MSTFRSSSSRHCSTASRIPSITPVASSYRITAATAHHQQIPQFEIPLVSGMERFTRISGEFRPGRYDCNRRRGHNVTTDQNSLQRARPCFRYLKATKLTRQATEISPQSAHQLPLGFIFHRDSWNTLKLVGKRSRRSHGQVQVLGRI
jgi:hypothetical protein